jgi:O-antigen/teichoic acid export membrane protein
MAATLGSAIKDTAKHSAIYGLGASIPRVVTFLLLPILVRQLTPAEFGIWAMLQSVALLSSSVFACGLDSAFMRSYYDYDEEDPRKIVVGTTIFLLLGASVILNIIGNIGVSYISSMLFQSIEYVKLIRITIASTTLMLLLSIPYVVFRALKKSKAYIFIQSGSAIFKLILLTIVLLVADEKLLGVVYVELFVSLCLFCILYWSIKHRIKFGFDFLEAGKLLRFGIPLVPTRFFYAVVNSADRYFLSHFMSLSAVGIYAVGMKISQVVTFLLTKPIQMIFPVMSFSIDKEDFSSEFYVKTFTYYIYAGVFLCLGISLFAKEILIIVGKQDYLASQNVIPVLALAFLLGGLQQNLQISIFVERKTLWLPAIAGGGCLVNLLLNWKLISIWGAFGAAFALFSTRLILAIAVYAVARSYRKVSYEWGRIFKIVTTSIALYYLGLLYDFDHLLYAIFYKSLLLIMFPIVLFLVDFFREEEKTRLRRLAVNFKLSPLFR